MLNYYLIVKKLFEVKEAREGYEGILGKIHKPRW